MLISIMQAVTTEQIIIFFQFSSDNFFHLFPGVSLILIAKIGIREICHLQEVHYNY